MGIPVRICHAHNAPHGIDLKSPVRWYMKTRMRPYITHRFMCGYESGLWLFGSRYRDSFIQMNNAVDAAAFRFDAARRAEVRRMLELPEGSRAVQLPEEPPVPAPGFRCRAAAGAGCRASAGRRRERPPCR